MTGPSTNVGKVIYLISLSGLSENEIRIRSEYARRYLDPSIDFELRTVASGPAFLDQRHHFGSAISATLDDVADLTPDEADVMILAGALDPGISEVRAATRIPVVGPGETALFLAAAAGKATSLVTVDEHAVAAAREFVDAAPVRPEMVSIRSMHMPVSRIVADRSEGRRVLTAEIVRAVEEDGAGTVVLGSMTLPTLEVERSVHERCGVVIVNPVRTALLAATEIVRSGSN